MPPKIVICKMFCRFLVPLVLFLGASAAFAGPGSGGGGGVVYRDGKPILLDFLILNREFKDQDTFGSWQASRLPLKKIAPSLVLIAKMSLQL